MKAVIHLSDATRYPTALPFAPPERYPELAGLLPAEHDPDNRVYAAVRQLLGALETDAEHFGTSAWSPFSPLVRPGGRVVIKPNFVRHYHERGGDFSTVVTHLSVLRPLVDYALLAVGAEGSVVIADAPQYDCDVDELLARTRLPELLAWYRDALGARVEWRDLRVEYGRQVHGVQVEKHTLAGDPEGYVAVDLGSASEFTAMTDHHVRLLRGADYDEEETISHHSGGRNEYLVSRTVLEADLVVNVPKIKTHKKSGVTLSMKNLIGINGDKNWLPHYRAGFPKGGGDEFPRPDAYARVRRLGADFARELLKRGIAGPVLRRLRAVENATGLGDRTRNGNWWGNDTIWRTAIDLNKIFYLGDRQGRLGARRRNVLNVYDGIVAGEADGPMAPDPRPVGLLAAGEDGVAVDVVIAWILGFDWRRIPILAHAIGALAGDVRITAFDGEPSHLSVCWLDSEGRREISLADIDLDLRFEPHPGWRGRIERTGRDVAQSS